MSNRSSNHARALGNRRAPRIRPRKTVQISGSTSFLISDAIASALIAHLAERMEPFVLAGSGFNAAIHFEHPAWTGMRTHRLLHETLVPVCHPALLGNSEGPPSLDELPRLHRRQNPDAWQRYAQATGIALANPAVGARYDLHSMQIEAALAGLGVALVPRIYIKAELAEGRLVAPWPDGESISKTFCLILPETIQLSDGPMQVFANWLLTEARSSNQTL